MPKPHVPMSRRHPLGPRVRVDVTAELINTSTRSHSSHCMIAEAIKAAVPTATHVAVDISTCRFSDMAKGFRYVFLTPRAAQNALVDFDEGLVPKPFAFTLQGAHVSRAGRAGGQRRAAAASGNANDPNAPKKKPNGNAGTIPSRARLVGGTNRWAVPRRVGGKRPPQLHVRREFGLRQFRAASLKRLKVEQAAAVEEMHEE